MHNLTGLSSESNCPGKRRNLPRHAQGAAHAPTGNRLSTEPAMGGNRQCNPVLHHLPPTVSSPFDTYNEVARGIDPPRFPSGRSGMLQPFPWEGDDTH